jgi:NADH-quinone oxidoreductase subunit J
MIETVFLAIFALGAVSGAVAMFFLRHPMRVALALIGTMLSLAAIYAQLGLHVIAVFQVLVYVGAVMVFMVYAIMLLDTRDRSFTERFSPLLVAGSVGLALLVVVLLSVLLRGEPLPGTGGAVQAGKTFAIVPFAREFMDGYWLYFALVAVLLLVAEIAATAVLEIRRRATGGPVTGSPATTPAAEPRHD